MTDYENMLEYFGLDSDEFQCLPTRERNRIQHEWSKISGSLEAK